MALDSDRLAAGIATALDNAGLLTDKAATEDIWKLVAQEIVKEFTNHGEVPSGIDVEVDTGTGVGATTGTGGIE